MKHILIPVVISTLIISQIIPINVSATTNNDTSTSEASLGSGETIGEITVEIVSQETSVGSSSTDTVSQNSDTTISTTINDSVVKLPIMESAPAEEDNTTYTPWEIMHKTFITS